VSHYIVARLPQGSLPLDGGMSIISLLSLRHSGFDVYETYEAVAHHAGSSGDGRARAVDGSLARRAYVHALAWAASLQETCPEEFAAACPDFPGLDHRSPDLDEGVQDEALVRWACEFPVTTKWADDEDARERVFCRVQNVLTFAREVYRASLAGPVAIVFT
jgi:hypothetical protein